jgi:DNA (cytosine-5)-methyltransferase 1
MVTSFTFADLCAGIGGFRLGLESLGGKCMFSSDINLDCEKTYFANHNEKYDEYNIFDIDESNFPSVDVLCAGFPCQPFSIAGKRIGFDDERGTVFFKIASIAKTSKPKIIFLENVANLVKIDKGKTLKTIFNELEEIGYNVHYEILDSSNFGIPQSRKRVYIIAIDSSIQSFGFQFTKKTTAKIPFKAIINQGDFSIPISSKWQTYIDLYTGKISKEDVPFDIPKTRKSLERKDSDADLNNCIFQIRSSGIRALSINKPLPTFAVSVSGGGAMIPVYSKERRHLSLIEMKRLMGFSDDFKFPVSRTNAIKQLANAVCPPVITSICNDILPYLNKFHERPSLVENPSISQYI